MPIGIGSQLGSHEVLSALGKGGMGEVWRARDSKLGREVAIKTLPVEFASDGDRLARFEREARLLASLNHPNIASIYGLEEFAGTRFIVLELIEGETLADVVRRRPVPVEDALKLAIQIAAAVEAAHEKGVVHRDLKPSNIKITPEGKVKVLDFGLAKALQTHEQDVSNSPTLSMAGTAHGIILGTAAYMSPEQARGMAIDGRTDVWAFGCVLYEMLTGRQAFRGDMVSDILASVLARDPDLTPFDTRLHPRLKEILQRCLEKDPKRRWQAIGDVRMDLERLLATGVLAPATTGVLSPKAKLWMVLPWVAAAVFVAACAAWVLKPAATRDPRPIGRFEYELPETQSFRSTGRSIVAFSPDGRHFVYNTSRGLFLRSMDSEEARLISGTEDALFDPFFSPDGEWIAYYTVAGPGLRKITIAGGAPVTIGPSDNPFGASWSADGTILFAQPEGVMRVSANGGTPELVIKTKNGEVAHGPSLLPDGKTILFTLTRVQGDTRWNQAEIVAQAMGAAEPKVLLRGGSDARYLSTGHLAYAVGDALFAIPFDVDALEVKGERVLMVQGVQRATAPGVNSAAANFGFSDGGALVYLKAGATATPPQGTLGIVDRSGAVRSFNLPPANYRNPRASPDGRSIAFETMAENGQLIIWVYDLTGNTAPRRLTQEGNNSRPIWTRDSKRIAYGSDREEAHGIWWQPADGSGSPERLTTAEEGSQHFPESWSPEDVLSFGASRLPMSLTGWGIWTLDLKSSGRKPSLFYDLPTSNETGSAFSPDGKWIAYFSNEGTAQQFGIYIQPYPRTGAKYEISRTGGVYPVWSPSGGELFFRLSVATDSNVAKFKAVTITTKPVPGFTSDKDLPIQGFLPVLYNREYDIMPSGREFVMVFPAAQTASAPPPKPRIGIVLNWLEELKARVPHP